MLRAAVPQGDLEELRGGVRGDLKDRAVIVRFAIKSCAVKVAGGVRH